MWLRNAPKTLATLLLAAGVTACESGVSLGDTARVSVLLTDAAAEYIAAAEVDIGAVELIPSDGGGPVTLSADGTDGPVDLLTLQDGVTEVLVEAEIEAGVYTQLRLIVESASVTLVDGYQFNDGSTQKDLFVPSGAQTGIKLLLGAADDGDAEGGLELVDEMILVVDFDVSQSFVIEGSPETPAGIFGVLFKPTLRVVVEDISGTISGTVSTGLDDFEVEGVSVTARPEEDGALETATAVTGDDGAYTLRFLVPGSYWVKLTLGDGLASAPDSTLVEVDPSEDVADVDFQVVDDS